MIPDNIRKIAQTIGNYFLEKNQNDYNRTELDLLRLGISSIEEREDGKIAITTTRPGMLIGKRGEAVDELQKRLGKRIHIIEEKDALIYWLMPMEEDEDAKDWYNDLYDFKEDWLT